VNAGASSTVPPTKTVNLMAENKFIMKGRDANEYFANTGDKYLKALQDIRGLLSGYRPCDHCEAVDWCTTPKNCPFDKMEEIKKILAKTIGGVI